MRNLTKSLALASIGAAVLSVVQAQAQFSVSTGDVLLSLRDATIPGTDVIVDLGNYSQFTSGQSYSYNFGSAFNLASSHAGDSIVYSVLGYVTTGNPTRSGYDTDYATQQGGLPALGVRPKTDTLNLANAVASVATGVTGNALVTTPDSHQVTTSVSGAYGNAILGGDVGGGFGGNVEAALGTSADFYILTPSGVSGLTGSTVSTGGSFVFNADGTGSYSAAVPEPTTFGVLAGVGLLMVSLRRQFKGQQA